MMDDLLLDEECIVFSNRIQENIFGFLFDPGSFYKHAWSTFKTKSRFLLTKEILVITNIIFHSRKNGNVIIPIKDIKKVELKGPSYGYQLFIYFDDEKGYRNIIKVKIHFSENFLEKWLQFFDRLGINIEKPDKINSRKIKLFRFIMNVSSIILILLIFPIFIYINSLTFLWKNTVLMIFPFLWVLIYSFPAKFNSWSWYGFR